MKEGDNFVNNVYVDAFFDSDELESEEEARTRIWLFLSIIENLLGRDIFYTYSQTLVTLNGRSLRYSAADFR